VSLPGCYACTQHQQRRDAFIENTKSGEKEDYAERRTPAMAEKMVRTQSRQNAIKFAIYFLVLYFEINETL
jgi:hypothetical protein